MAKLGLNIIFSVGDDGEIVLRQPTNEEFNNYQADKIEAQSEGRDIPALNKVMAELFDTLIVSIDKIEDEKDQPITIDSLDKILIKEKSAIIIQAVDLNNQGIEIKN